MSLFNETVKRVAELEAELEKYKSKPAPKVAEDLHKRDLTKINRPAPSYSTATAYKVNGWGLPRRYSSNELSEDDIEQLFQMHKEARVAELVDAAGLKPASDLDGVQVQSLK
jgi:hypothetical protein